ATDVDVRRIGLLLVFCTHHFPLAGPSRLSIMCVGQLYRPCVERGSVRAPGIDETVSQERLLRVDPRILHPSIQRIFRRATPVAANSPKNARIAKPIRCPGGAVPLRSGT